MPLPTINLGPVDELIRVRQQQHGGNPGAPPIVGGARVGAALNKSCVLMLSALLQGYVEDVFIFASICVILLNNSVITLAVMLEENFLDRAFV